MQMRYGRSRRRAPIARWILLSLPLSMTGCAGIQLTPPILAAIKCGPLIPQSDRQPIPSPGQLPIDASPREALIHDDRAIEALNRANGQTHDVLKIVDVCD